MLRCDRIKALELDKGLGAVAPAAIEHACNDNDTVDLSGREFFLVLNQPHSCFHGRVVLFLVELPLAQEEEVNRLCALPRIGERLISRRTDIARNQRVHSLCGNISCCLTCARDLSDLRVEHSLLVRVDFEGREHVDFLDQQERGILLSQLLGYFGEQFG